MNESEIRHDERMECIKVIERMQQHMIDASPGQLPDNVPLKIFHDLIRMFGGIYIGGIRLRDTNGDLRVLGEEVMKVWNIQGDSNVE